MTTANYSQMIDDLKNAAVKVASKARDPNEIIAMEIGLTAGLLMIDIAASLSRIAGALEQQNAVVNEEALKKDKKFPTV